MAMSLILPIPPVLGCMGSFFKLKNILSFPLSLLNNNLPFYLEYRELPQYIFISVPINIILQSIFRFLIIKLFKWGIQTLNNK